MADDEAPTRRSCAASEVHRQLLSVDPDYRQARQEIEDQTDAEQARGFAAAAPRTRTIPTVVHVVYRTQRENISERPDRQPDPHPQRGLPHEERRPQQGPGRLQAAARRRADPVPARDQGPVRQRHRPASRARGRRVPSFSFDDGVKSSRTGGRRPWPARPLPQHLGLQRSASGLLGYAQFPGGPGGDRRRRDPAHRVRQRPAPRGAPFDKGRTTTHEVGHWLNLFHIWGDDGTGCRGADHVPDTPTQASANFGEPAFPHVSCNNGPNGDLFMDYMDYVDDARDVHVHHRPGDAHERGAQRLAQVAVREHAAVPGRARPGPRRRPAVKKVQEELRDRWDHPDLRADGSTARRPSGSSARSSAAATARPWKPAATAARSTQKTWAALFA